MFLRKRLKVARVKSRHRHELLPSPSHPRCMRGNRNGAVCYRLPSVGVGAEMTKEQLAEILEDHKLWLIDPARGKRANLRRANLLGANLLGADLECANLEGAHLEGAHLEGADLEGADLQRANLRGAGLRGANLRGANLCGANLRGANLLGANLLGADLQCANLRGAHLEGADLDGVCAARLMTCPESGAFDAWKKCNKGVVVKLRIPAKAKRSSATGRKCRAEFAKVLAVFGGEVGVSNHDGKTEYRKGETVHCDNWCEDRWQECAGGIHFFITRAEAEAY